MSNLSRETRASKLVKRTWLRAGARCARCARHACAEHAMVVTTADATRSVLLCRACFIDPEAVAVVRQLLADAVVAKQVLA